MKARTWVVCAAALGMTMGALPAGASLEKLQQTRVPLLFLLIEAFEVEGEAYNLSNETVAVPSFHSVRWNPASRTMEWRFWVPSEGALAGRLRAMKREDAVTLLKLKMKDLSVFVGLEPFPGLDAPMGCLATVNVPGRNLLSEEEWATARRQLAAASVIRLAAAHAGGPICLVRSQDGRITEEAIGPSAKQPGAAAPAR